MSVLAIVICVIAALAIMHYIQGRSPETQTRNTDEIFAGWMGRINGKKKGLPGIGRDVLEGISCILPHFTYRDTVVAKIIIGIFHIIMIPLWLILVALTALIVLIFGAIVATKELLVNEHTENGHDKEHKEGLPQSMLLAILCIIAVVIFTAANYQILKIGLPAIWPVEKKAIAYIFGHPISAISVLAILMIIAEFFLGLLRSEFKKRNSHFVGHSPGAAAMCLVGLLALCAIESLLAVYRTMQLNAQGESHGIPLIAVAVVSFIVPLIAAIAFEYASRYLLWLIGGVIIFVLGILWIATFFACLLLIWLEALILQVFEILTIPFHGLHEGAKMARPKHKMHETVMPLGVMPAVQTSPAIPLASAKPAPRRTARERLAHKPTSQANGKKKRRVTS